MDSPPVAQRVRAYCVKRVSDGGLSNTTLDIEASSVLSCLVQSSLESDCDRKTYD
jgi:hypothetical protein